MEGKGLEEMMSTRYLEVYATHSDIHGTGDIHRFITQ